MQRIYWTNIVTEAPSEMCAYLYAVIQVSSKFEITSWDFCLTLGYEGGDCAFYTVFHARLWWCDVLTVFSSVADGFTRSSERERGGGGHPAFSARVLCPKSRSFSPSDVRRARVAYALAIHSGRLTPHRHKTARRKVKYLPPGENKALSLC